MNAPDDIFTSAPDWWLVAPWPLPEPMTEEQYQREAIASAQSTMPDDEPEEE